MPYKPDNPSGKMPPDNVPMGKRAQWSAIWNSTFDETGSEARAFAAANAILSEDKMSTQRKAIKWRQSDAHYNTVSSRTGEAQCANCRWFTPCEGGGYCQIVEDYPDAILATGYCDQWAAMPPPESVPMPVMLVENMEPIEMAYQGLDQPPADPGAISKLLSRKANGVTITKGEDGLRQALIIGSNGYQDRDKEHVSTVALQEYVESQWEGETFKGDNIADFWHLVDIGDIIFADLVDGFLIEVAKERPGPIPRHVWDYLETNPDGIEWGASIAFKMLEPKDGDTFRHIRKTATAILPREAASNVITLTEVVDMKKASEILASIYGVPEAAALLKERKFGELNHLLAAAGNQVKAVEEADAPADSAEAGTPELAPGYLEVIQKMGTAFVDLIEAQAEQDDRLTAIETARQTEQTERQKVADDAQTDLAAVKATLDEIKSILNDEPRASKSAKTLVTEEADIAKLKKQVKEPPDPRLIGSSVIDYDAVNDYREARNVRE